VERSREMSVFPTKILLATDGSGEAELAARTAVELAEKTGSELHVAHVGETSVPPFYSRIREQIENDARTVLDEQVKRIEDSGGKVAETHLRVGEPEKEVVVLAQELGVGLVIVGGRGKGAVRRYLVGDVAEAVFRHAPCPVMVVRSQEE
jgi:nucleotide-binding universal stress UspA family protein